MKISVENANYRDLRETLIIYNYINILFKQDLHVIKLEKF